MKATSLNGDVNDQPVDAFMERDWSRGDVLQYPCRNHVRNWVREEFLNRWRNFGLNYTHTTGGEASNYSARDLVGEVVMQMVDTMQLYLKTPIHL